MKSKNPVVLDEKTGCWMWTGAVDCYQHPITSIRGKVIRVNQLNFEKKYGYWPKRITKTCGTNLCVNPSHMKDAFRERKEHEVNLGFIKIEPRLQFLRDVIASVEGDARPEAIEATADFKKELGELEKKYGELVEAKKVLDSTSLQSKKEEVGGAN